MNKQRIFALISFFSITSLKAQQSTTYTRETAEFNKAATLYKKKNYQASQILFEKVKHSTNNSELQSDCAYYIANCAIRLDQLGADSLMERFVEDYPTSTKQNSAFREVADYYFEQGAYQKSLEWLERTNENSLSQ